MKNLTIDDILKATDGRLVKGDAGCAVSGISTDSRTLKKGDLFVALIGERFDGHKFAAQAATHGASGLLVSSEVGNVPVANVVMVADTLQALGRIAGSYRSRFHIPVIGITGSNGKTTTKNMMASVLSKKYNVLKNEGNLNNAIGVPLTLFGLSGEHDIAVIEMGTGAPGEMSRLVEIAKPDVAVVTNIGPTHLEFFGSLASVAAEKAILARAANSAVLNADDPLVANMRNGMRGRIISFGLGKADVSAVDMGQDRHGRSEFTLVTKSGETKVHLSCLGKHNVYNALAAAAAGVLFNLELAEIKEALEAYEEASMRMQKEVVNGFTIINDTYNSNPVSLRAAVDFLSVLECDGKRILAVGDMLELGEQSDELHREAGRFVASRPVNILVTVGEKAARIAEAALAGGIPKDKVKTCETNGQAVAYLREMIAEGDVVLVKGSRGMKMEEIVEGLKS